MTFSVLVAALLLFSAFSLVFAVFVPREAARSRSASLEKAALGLTVFSLFVALVGAVSTAFLGPISVQFLEIGAFHLGVYFDALSAILFALISFLGVVVARFARNYLAGDAHVGRFFRGFCITTGAALLLVISGNLLLFTLAWMAMSLGLHGLLTLYPERAGAALAARKKFLISRLGDACLIGALVFSYRLFGSWDFETLFARAAELKAAGVLPAEASAIALFLVGGAMLKSAQFPFHSWLPDTMETPTPVSALMHAGIVNAGGFLIIRLSPLVSLAPLALQILAIVGAFTAIFAAIVMTTQTSVKRSLAFSTVAQMGFMMLQCGLGAFSVAVLHIVAHSLYKAHAFLSSGSNVAPAKGTLSMPSARPLSAGFVGAAFGCALLVVTGVGALLGITPEKEPGVLLLGAVLVLALTQFLLGLWRGAFSPLFFGAGLGVVAAMSAAYFALHLAFSAMLRGAVPVSGAAANALEIALCVLVLGAIAGVAAARSARLPQWGRAFYVHALNGFYLHTYANRLLSRR